MTFNSAIEKRQFVNEMFTRIAPRYDLMNRLMTGGQDQYWRQLLIKQIQLPPQGKLLDVATGTGDIAFEAVQQHPDLAHVVGADFTLPMISVGQKRQPLELPPESTTQFSWQGADALSLPFASNSFDAVVSGFLMRNVTDVGQAIKEQQRVCKPGGRVAILEIPRPADNPFGAAFRLYFHQVVPLLGGLISGHRDAYTYLPHSADAFLRPDELKAVMAQAGLREIRYTMLMFSTVALHVGCK